MIKENTVLILGAGASKPYGFPLGSELRDDVIKAKVSTMWAYALLAGMNIERDYYDGFINDLATSGCPSVDEFLENRSKWLDVGKLATAYNLLIYERDASLFPPNQPKDHWYQSLWLKLSAPSWNKFKENKIKIITFNYDRSLEHYLFAVLSNNYKIGMKKVAKALPIIHVHGDLGTYEYSVFGREITGEVIKTGAESIKIVHESDSSSKEFMLADRILCEAKKILFIGFGYHSSNMKKLSIFNRTASEIRGKVILGTHKGFKARAWAGICNKYAFSPEAKGQGGGTISDFLSEWL